MCVPPFLCVEWMYSGVDKIAIERACARASDGRSERASETAQMTDGRGGAALVGGRSASPLSNHGGPVDCVVRLNHRCSNAGKFCGRDRSGQQVSSSSTQTNTCIRARRPAASRRESGMGSRRTRRHGAIKTPPQPKRVEGPIETEKKQPIAAKSNHGCALFLSYCGCGD